MIEQIVTKAITSKLSVNWANFIFDRVEGPVTQSIRVDKREISLDINELLESMGKIDLLAGMVGGGPGSIQPQEIGGEGIQTEAPLVDQDSSIDSGGYDNG